MLAAANLKVSGSKGDKDSLNVLCSADIKDLASEWAKSYKSGQNSIVITELNDSVKGITLNGSVAIVSSEHPVDFSSNEYLRFVIGRNIVVTVFNSKNPYMDAIMSEGIPSDKLQEAMKDRSKANWGYLLGGNAADRITMHVAKDKVVLESIARITGPTENIDVVLPEDSRQMLKSVMEDKYSIGFCRLSDIQYSSDTSLMRSINLLPLDKDGNGSLDYSENIFKDITSFTRGVWIGKYQKSLYSNIYFIMPVSENKEAKSFLDFILNEGQETIEKSGFTTILPTEKVSINDRIVGIPAIIDNPVQKSVFKGIFIFIGALIAVLLLFQFAARMFRRKPADGIIENLPRRALNENTLIFPAGMYFDKTHTWAFLEQNGYVRTGIDDFILRLTGPLNRIEMKNEGDKVKKGEVLLSLVQNGKKISLYSPVTGTIRRRNSLVGSDPSIINNSPYSEGWVYMIEPDNWQRENQLLFMTEKHKQFITGELVKIKDMLASLVSKQENLAIALQDGGMLYEGFLSEMSPEAWEEFQIKIIDPSKQVWFYEII